MSAQITAVVVSFADPAASSAAVDSLMAQSSAPLEVLVVDNDPAGATAEALGARQLVRDSKAVRATDEALGTRPLVPDKKAVRATAGAPYVESRSPLVRVIHPGANLGYTGAANLAAQQAKGEWLFFLNPDATAASDCLERLLAAADGDDVAIVGAQVLLPDGRVNAGDNPINLAGISWAGGYGEPREYGPSRDTAAVSGAALMVRRETFLEIGGLCPHFFMYYDDADLAWRARLIGKRVRYCPEAIVVHAYEFEKGAHKWFYLERNRAWALFSNLKIRTLLFLAPLLLGAEALIVARAIWQGWLREKGRAWVSLVAQAPSLVRWRKLVQMTRNVSDYTILAKFSGGIQTQLIDTHFPRWVNPALEHYRQLVLRQIENPDD
jgi:GT2 family glycosyltransferase